MDKNYIVKKSNYFIMNSSYDLSLEEQKLILTLASMVQPIDEDFKPYIFKISEFMNLLGVDTKTKYTEVPKITKELMKKVFEIDEDDEIIQIAWLSSATYKKGRGIVELEFSPKLKPYMLKLNSMFTQYKLSNILSMKSKYSPRIYEILKCNEFKKQGFIELYIDELRKLLKAEYIYPRYNDFKRKIIEQSQKELNSKTDISFEFEEVKTGRKVTSLKFYINSNKSKKLNATKIIEAIDEVSATVLEDMEVDNIIEIKSIIKNICNKKISDKAANDFYKLASQNKDFNNNPLKLINEIADYS
uniref:replication initiation protein n=1 Tax=Clostridium sp. TaxID=1506 RepID=UPI002620B9D3